MTYFWFEVHFEIGVEVLESGFHHGEIHAADEVRVLLRELVERAVPEDNGPVLDRAGFEPVVFQSIENDAAPGRGFPRA